jgi:hypothetical protein
VPVVSSQTVRNAALAADTLTDEINQRMQTSDCEVFPLTAMPSPVPPSQSQRHSVREALYSPSALRLFANSRDLPHMHAEIASERFTQHFDSRRDSDMQLLHELHPQFVTRKDDRGLAVRTDYFSFILSSIILSISHLILG